MSKFRKSRHILCFVACLIFSNSNLAPVFAVGSEPTNAPHQVYLPLAINRGKSIIEVIADSLPSNSECNNCLTREAFLSMPPEELALVEKSEVEMQRLGEKLALQDQLISDMISRGEINVTTWPQAEQVTGATPEELQQMLSYQKADLTQFVTSADLSIFLATNGSVPIAHLPAANITDNINSCGPASIRVALSVRLAVSQIESIDSIGKTVDKNPDGTQGNWKNGLEAEDLQRMVVYLNTKLGFGANTPYYKVGSSGWAGANAATQFRAKANNSINTNLAMIFGVKSGGLPDWWLNASHITTVYGVTYDAQGNTLISYADTAPIVSGHYKKVNNQLNPGAFYNTLKLGDLWPKAAGNDFQLYN